MLMVSRRKPHTLNPSDFVPSPSSFDEDRPTVLGEGICRCAHLGVVGGWMWGGSHDQGSVLGGLRSNAIGPVSCFSPKSYPQSLTQEQEIPAPGELLALGALPESERIREHRSAGEAPYVLPGT